MTNLVHQVFCFSIEGADVFLTGALKLFEVCLAETLSRGVRVRLQVLVLRGYESPREIIDLPTEPSPSPRTVALSDRQDAYPTAGRILTLVSWF